MNTAPLTALANELRTEAATLRRYGAEGEATAVETCAAKLEERLRAWELEELSLDQAAAESGYSYSTLQQRLADGSLPNSGGKGRPAIRRCDLPTRGGASKLRAVDGGPDLAAEILGRRAAS